ncbi:MAG: hypothetical protein EXR93_08035 [Gemmatimonadetes bacterium]|nr:hypothetical protein [Gemmatimonadota bacterium]
MANICLGIAGFALTGVVAAAAPAQSQGPWKPPGSPNVHVLAHVPLGRAFTVAGIEVEQDLARPFAYVSRKIGGTSDPGFDIIQMKTPGGARRIYSWRIDHPELHTGLGALEGKYFKTRGRYYYVEVFQFLPSGPDAELGAIIFDVTSLPDTTGIREVGRIMAPNSAREAAGDVTTAQRRGSAAATPGGFHNVFPYKHSDGRVLMLANTLTGTDAKIYDMNKFLSGDSVHALVGIVPVPGATGRYHDYYVGYDPATHQDKFYGGVQPGGYFVFDITRPEAPILITSVTMGYPSITSPFGRGHTTTPSPDGRYLVTETEYQYAPLRIFDLKPGLDKTVETITRPIGAWTARWKGLPHNHEVRWPYVFASAYEDGLQIFNLMDPTNPYTVGYYDTYAGPLQAGIAAAGQNEGTLRAGTGGVLNGAWGIDVRNADGIIVISDEVTGFWAFSLDGFDHWNGKDWGMPNISSVQDWDKGPGGG